MAEPLTTTGAELTAHALLTGIVTRVLGSAAYELVLKKAGARVLQQLRALARSGAPADGHHLLRALWTAQEQALVLCCEDVLLREKRLRPGGLAIPEELTDWDAWASTFGGNDPEVKGLLKLRSTAIKRARSFEKTSPVDLLRQTTAALEKLPTLLKQTADGEPLPLEDLETQATDLLMARLQAELKDDGGVPAILEPAVRGNWFAFLRVSFREVLVKNPDAKAAFDLHLWSKLEDVPIKLDDALARLARLDWSLDQVAQNVRWLVEAVEAVAAGIDAQHAQTQEGLRELRDAIERDSRIGEAEAKLAASLSRLERKLDYAIAGLPIRRFEQPDPPTQELQLLQAKHRASDLLARETDLAALWEWLSGEASISVRLLVGGAGTGKTRLAYELLLRANSELPGWHAGTLSAEALRKFDATKQPADWSWSAPTLVVIDYAQPLADALGRLLRALTFKRKAGFPPLRILLLERVAGDWFDALLREEDSEAPCPVSQLFEPLQPVQLTPLPEGELRRKLLAQTLEKAAPFTGQPAPALPPDTDEPFAASLARDIFAEPLNLMLAALAASELGLSAALTRSRIELAEVLAEKELRRIERFARDPDNAAQKRVMRHLAGCAALERGFALAELDQAVSEELQALQLTWPDGPGDLAPCLKSALPHERLAVSGIEPDFIGEAVALTALARPDTQSGPDRWRTWSRTVERCARRDAFTTPATILHAFQNFGHREDYGEPLIAATHALIAAGVADEEPGLLVGIESALPHQTTNLLSPAVDVTQHLYSRLKTALEAGQERLSPEVAGVANNLGVRLSNAGRPSDALAPSQEAVDLYGALAAQNPDAFQPDLALSLHNLANRLGEVGRRAEALAPAQKAVEIRRALATQNRDAYQPSLAMSLDNLATSLSNVGRRSEALAPAQEAVKLYSALAIQNRDAYQPDLAMSLNNLANRLSKVGHRAEALTPAQEAVDLYRALANRNPDAYNPDLASSLNNLATFLSKVGRRAEALGLAQEAVGIRRALAAQNPDAYQPDLAMSLGMMGRTLEANERPVEARSSYAEGIQVLTPALVALPQAFAPLAGGLAQDYLRLSQQLNLPPDEALLAPVVEAFQKLQEAQDAAGGKNAPPG